MPLYACPDCGVVQTNDEECGNCPTDGGLEEVSGGDEEEEYVCDDCGRSFDNPQGLASHSRTHNDDEE